MLKFVFKTITTSAIGIVLLSACSRTTKDQELIGPNTVCANADFSVTNDTLFLKSTSPTLDFTTIGNQLYFESMFSSQVTWNIKIKSRVNGATKTLSGTSDKLDVVTGLWNGGSDYLLFSTGDTCDVEMTFLCHKNAQGDPFITDSKFVIKKGPLYSNTNGIKNVAFVDFETTGLVGFTPPYSDVAPGTNYFSKEVDSVKAHGKFGFYVKGEDPNSNGYIGGFDMKLPGVLAGKVSSTLTNPDDLYINMYVKGYGKTNTGLTLIMYELDSLYEPGYTRPIPQIVGAPDTETAFMNANNDKWIKQIQVDWVGWKLVSVKYSEFSKPSGNGCLGNCKLEPHKVRSMSAGIDSYPNPGYSAEFAVDYFVLSEYSPFNPQ
jgi:hypothetical protein